MKKTTIETLHARLTSAYSCGDSKEPLEMSYRAMVRRVYNEARGNTEGTDCPSLRQISYWLAKEYKKNGKTFALKSKPAPKAKQATAISDGSNATLSRSLIPDIQLLNPVDAGQPNLRCHFLRTTNWLDGMSTSLLWQQVRNVRPYT